MNCVAWLAGPVVRISVHRLTLAGKFGWCSVLVGANTLVGISAWPKPRMEPAPGYREPPTSGDRSALGPKSVACHGLTAWVTGRHRDRNRSPAITPLTVDGAGLRAQAPFAVATNAGTLAAVLTPTKFANQPHWPASVSRRTQVPPSALRETHHYSAHASSSISHTRATCRSSATGWTAAGCTR